MHILHCTRRLPVKPSSTRNLGPKGSPPLSRSRGVLGVTGRVPLVSWVRVIVWLVKP